MTNQKKLEIKVGIVSFMSIILLVIGLSLGKGCNVTETSQILKFHFPNSGGIIESSPVVVNGVKRGVVTSVRNFKDYVLITATINSIEDLKSDANARISILEITGGKKIEISPGTSTQKFDPNLEIQGGRPSDIADVVALAGDLGSDASMLVRRLDTITKHISDALADDKTVQQIKQIVNNTSELTSTLNSELDKNIGDINLIVKNLKSITSDLKVAIQDNKPRLESLIGKIDNMADSTTILLKNVNKAVFGAENLIAELNNISNAVRTGNGFASKILFDAEFSLKIDSTLASLRQLADFVRINGINTNVRLGTRP